MLEFIGFTLSVAVGTLLALGILMVVFMSPFVMGWYIKKSIDMANKMTARMFKDEETN